MKNNKQIVFVLLLVIIMFIIVIVVSKKAIDKEDLIKQNTNEYYPEMIEYGDGKDEEKESGNIDWKKGYFAITRILNIFSNTLKENDNEKILKLVDQKYLEKNNNLNTLKNKYKTDKAIIYSGSYENISENITLYNVKSNIGDLYIKVELINNTIDGLFSIIPEKLENEENLKEKIAENDLNRISFDGGTNDEIAQNLYLRYIYTCINDLNEAYNLLDENYKNQKFRNFNSFDYYIRTITVDTEAKISYTFNTNFYMTEYRVTDIYGNTFIFYYDNNIEYTLTLDGYTEMTNMQIDKYISLDDVDKAKENLNYFIQAINTFDYQTAYSKLMEETKREFYPNQESFTSFIDQNLFTHNVLDIKELSDNDEKMYQFNIELKNQKNFDEKVKLNIIVKLIENNDYEIAFSIDNK